MNRKVTFQTYANSIESLPKAIKVILSIASVAISIFCVCIGIIYIWKFGNYMGLFVLAIGLGAAASGFAYIKSINKGGQKTN